MAPRATGSSSVTCASSAEAARAAEPWVGTGISGGSRPSPPTLHGRRPATPHRPLTSGRTTRDAGETGRRDDRGPCTDCEVAMTAHKHLVPGTRARHRRAVALVIAALLAVTVGSAPASATIVERDRFTEPYEFVTGFCGYPMTVTGMETHNVVIRADKKVDGIVYVTDNYAFKETWTAPDGRWFTLSANAVGKDVKARSLGGTLYEFTFKQPGQPQVITDSRGRVVARDRGNLTFELHRSTSPTRTSSSSWASGPPGRTRASTPTCASSSSRSPAPTRRAIRRSGPSARRPSRWASPNTCRRATARRAPAARCCIFLHGYGETGDGTPEAIGNLLFAGIPRFIDVGGWATDRPFVVLSLQHVEDPPGFPFEDCNGSCNMFLQHERDHASARLLHDPRRGPRLPRLRTDALQHRPRPGLPHGAVVRRLRDVGVPGQVRRRGGRGGHPHRR